MMKQSAIVIACAGALFASASAMASDQNGSAIDQWFEEDSGGYQFATNFGIPFDDFDAGKRLSNANVTRGGGALNTITGFHAYWRDVDVYSISITDPSAFSATSSRATTSLALFDMSGTGIVYNRSQSLFDQTPLIDSSGAAGLSAGMYFLAVISEEFAASPASVLPLNAAGETIFNPTGAIGQFGPSAASGDNVLGEQDDFDAAGPWTQPDFSDTIFSFPYEVTMTGVGYKQLPAPGAAALFGLGGLVAARRRRA